MHYVGTRMASTALKFARSKDEKREDAGSGSPVQRYAMTRAYYDREAEDYAAKTIAIDTAGRISKFASYLPAGARVLDVGCGSGRDLIRLRAAGLKPVGLDISPSLAAIAQKNSNLPVTVGDLRTPPFADASFHGVWAMASLLHIEARELDTSLAGLLRILLPAGILFASVKRGRGLVRDEDGRWFTLHDETSWSCYLRAAGFEIIEIIDEPPITDNATGTVRPGWVTSLARRPA
jgi:SAM-dependent methyltransferase